MIINSTDRSDSSPTQSRSRSTIITGRPAAEPRPPTDKPGATVRSGRPSTLPDASSNILKERVVSSRASLPARDTGTSGDLKKRAERESMTTGRSRLGTPDSSSVPVNLPTRSTSRADITAGDVRPTRLPETVLASSRPKTKPSARSFGSDYGGDRHTGGVYDYGYDGRGSNRHNDYYGYGDSHRGRYDDYYHHGRHDYRDSWYHSRRYNPYDNYWWSGWSLGWNSDGLRASERM